MDTKNMSTQELIVLQNALSDYAVFLRTKPDPTDRNGDRVISEKAFLAMDISENRKENYLIATELLAATKDTLRARR